MATHSKCKHRQNKVENLQIWLIFHNFVYITYVFNQNSSTQFRLKSGHKNETEYYVHQELSGHDNGVV